MCLRVRREEGESIKVGEAFDVLHGDSLMCVSAALLLDGDVLRRERTRPTYYPPQTLFLKVTSVYPNNDRQGSPNLWRVFC